MYAAGVLPYTKVAGTTYFLVGKDIRDSSWSDFGGKCEEEDTCPTDTAVREFYEETCGVVLDLRAVRARLCPASRALLSSTQNGHPYHMYVLEVPFLPHLRAVFRRQLAYLKHRKLYKKNVEKTDIQWASLASLLGGRLLLRSVFESTVRAHVTALASL